MSPLFIIKMNIEENAINILKKNQIGRKEIGTSNRILNHWRKQYSVRQISYGKLIITFILKEIKLKFKFVFLIRANRPSFNIL